MTKFKTEKEKGVALAFRHLDFTKFFSKNSPLKTCPERSRRIRGERGQTPPLKIRGARPARQGLAGGNSLAGGGVMEVTPFIPLTLRGILKERPLIFDLELGFWDLGFEAERFWNLEFS